MTYAYEGWKPADLEGPDYADEWHPHDSPDQFYTLDRCRCCQSFTRVYISEEFTPEKGWICFECLKPLGWQYDHSFYPPMLAQKPVEEKDETLEQLKAIFQNYREVSGL